MMRASERYELFDTLAAMQLQVGARGEAPHAVSYEHELGGAVSLRYASIWPCN